MKAARRTRAVTSNIAVFNRVSMRAVSPRPCPVARPVTAPFCRLAASLTPPARSKIRSRYGHHVYALPAAPVDMDFLGLVRLRAGRCDADRYRDARRRHASRLDKAVRDHGCFMAAVGARNRVRHAPRTPLPSGEIEAARELA